MMHLMDKAEKTAYAEKLADRWGDRERWTKYYMQRDYIAFDDGVVVEVDRPHIESDIYFDDETPDPLGDTEESKKAGFFRHNLRYCFKDFGIDEWRRCEADLADHGCCCGWHVSKPFIAVWPDGQASPRFLGHEDDFKDDERRGMVRRPMTAEERGQLEAIIDGLRDKYVKRLETYWKRYSDHIYSHGYWANR